MYLVKSVHLCHGNRSSAMLALATVHSTHYGRETPGGSGNLRQVQPPATSGPNIAHSTNIALGGTGNGTPQLCDVCVEENKTQNTILI